MSPQSDRKSSSRRDWLLYLALAAIVCADVVVGLVDRRFEQQPAPVARTERYRVIQTFAATGRGPKAPMGLTVDKAGHLYGSTLTGGPKSSGTIFELIAPSQLEQHWEMRVLSNVDGETIGSRPIWSMIGQDGHLYGMTNDGLLYRLKRGDNGWDQPVALHSIVEPLSPLGTTLPALTPDGFGSFYGTTAGRGGTDAGTVFKLSPGPDGWTETVLHRFSRGNNDGGYPNSGLAIGTKGALYGTTSGGGEDGLGTVFKLTPTDHGWEKTLLHVFRQLDGSSGKGGLLPMAGLTLGDDGRLYGTTGGGGEFGEGVVFTLTPSDRDGNWSYRVLYNFKRGDGEGAAPNGRLVFGKSGALYGTTKFGGNAPGYEGFGTIFKLAPTAAGWGEVVLHSFAGGDDGARPTGVLVCDSLGNLFGTTEGTAKSGVNTASTVFEIETSAISESSSNNRSDPK